MNCRRTWMGIALALGCWGGSVCHAQIDVPNLPANFRVFKLGDDSAAIDSVFVAAVDATVDAEQPKYWIGLLCIDVSDALRAQLNLEANVGLLIDAVTEDSPASKQGLERTDILLSVRLAAEPPEKLSRKLSQVGDLVKIIQEAETKPLQFEILRRGVRKTIEVTPVERSTQIGNVLLGGILSDDTERRIHVVTPNTNDIRMFIAGPMFESARKSPPLPEGVLMEFHQVVGETEKVIVKKGDQKWETSVEEVAKLPDEIRVIVLQQLLARRSGPVPPIAVFPPNFTAPPVPPIVPAAPGAPVQPHVVSNGLLKVVTVNETAGNGDASKPVSVARVVFSSTTSLPENVTVSIVRKGSDPAQITVKKDDKSWEVTDKELNKLPEDVRKLVEPMIANQMKSARVEYSPHPVTPKKYGAPSEAHVSGNVVITTASPDDPNHTGPKVAENQRVRTLIRQQNSLDRDPEQAARLLARQAALEKQVQELTEKLKSLNDLKLLNEKIEKLQQSLDKALPK